MFDRIVIVRTSRTDSLIDLGTLAEILLFYDNIQLVLNRGTLTSLLRDLGADGFDRLLERPEIKTSFWSQDHGTISAGPPAMREHNFSVFEIATLGKRRMKRRENIEQLLERTLGRSAATRKRVNRIMTKMSFPRIEDDISAFDLAEAARKDLDDQNFVDEAIRRTINLIAPSFALSNNWHYRIMKVTGGSFAIDTNIPLDLLTQEYRRNVPSSDPITPEFLLNFIFDAHVGTFLASRYMSELVHDPVCASVMKIKYLNLMRRRERSVQEIDLFQDLHLESGRNIQGVMNSKERSLDEFFELLDRARKFKEWLRGKNPDESLIREYFHAVTEQTWVDKLPTKGFRWILTTGLGAAVESLYPTGVAITAAQGVSLLDATLLDRILKGWKPDQFVKGPLSKFVDV